MTHHPSLVARQQSFAGDANARKKQVERAGQILMNPAFRAPVV
jgi:hypothetical protein